MRKAFVFVLAMVFVLALTGPAFALIPAPSIDVKDINANVGLQKQYVDQDNKADQKAEIKQDAKATSGDANAVGNVSYTDVWATSSATSYRGIAINLGTKVDVDNKGTATAKSGDATAENNAKIDQDIDQDNSNKQTLDQKIIDVDKDKKVKKDGKKRDKKDGKKKH